MQNPRQFGEKFSGQRKIMMSGQLRSRSLMDKLVKSRRRTGGDAGEPGSRGGVGARVRGSRGRSATGGGCA